MNFKTNNFNKLTFKIDYGFRMNLESSPQSKLLVVLLKVHVHVHFFTL